jgi:hypothetical protein
MLSIERVNEIMTTRARGMSFVAESMVIVEGLIRSPLQSHQTTDWQSNPLHFGIGDTLVLAPRRKPILGLDALYPRPFGRLRQAASKRGELEIR